MHNWRLQKNKICVTEKEEADRGWASEAESIITEVEPQGFSMDH